jgi:hypothetical protein
MFSGGVEVTDPHGQGEYTAPQRFLKVGWGFFILMTTAA